MEPPVEQHQQPYVDDPCEIDIDPSAPGTSQTPLVSKKRQRELICRPLSMSPLHVLVLLCRPMSMSPLHVLIDTEEDKLKDVEEQGGPSRKGDMTRPLKNRKIRWQYRHWWSKEGEYIWYDHGARSGYDFETRGTARGRHCERLL
ncbi:hypothetical protein POM88_044614 [Heracleum sosnowskyi]|uniref:Uncharacterized protein n=1 Tax=Heracleum sosnowskyi TaxID=360622 RepID=A0AAD8H339_9APIA|nr:hypothetical protein POM88_044614 [Heracleum sosnowskyi]